MSTIAVKAVLVAVGGIAITMIASVSLVVLYCCVCHRNTRGEYQTRDQIVTSDMDVSLHFKT